MPRKLPLTGGAYTKTSRVRMLPPGSTGTMLKPIGRLAGMTRKEKENLRQKIMDT